MNTRVTKDLVDKVLGSCSTKEQGEKLLKEYFGDCEIEKLPIYIKDYHVIEVCWSSWDGKNRWIYTYHDYINTPPIRIQLVNPEGKIISDSNRGLGIKDEYLDSE